MAVKYCTGKRSARSVGRGAIVAHATPAQHQPRQQVPAVQDAISGKGMGSVSARSSLPPNEHSAPADPTSVVTTADADAQSQLVSATIFPALSAMFIDNAMDPSSTAGYTAYLARFDRPEEVSGRFRNRFSRTLFATENEAIVSELNSLSGRFSALGAYLDGGIRYISNSSARIRIGGCRDSCDAHPNWGAWTCFQRSARTIALCPLFWGDGTERGNIIVHELAHLRFGLVNHDFANQRQRARNPECYASYVADILGYSSFSGQCPSV
jgi:hypothetical protein